MEFWRVGDSGLTVNEISLGNWITHGALGAWRRIVRDRRIYDSENSAARQQLQSLASEVGLTLAQMAIAWVLQNPAFASLVIGASCAAQLTANAQATGTVLEPALLDRIEEILDPVVERSPDRVAAIVK